MLAMRELRSDEGLSYSKRQVRSTHSFSSM